MKISTIFLLALILPSCSDQMDTGQLILEEIDIKEIVDFQVNQTLLSALTKTAQSMMKPESQVKP